MEYSDFWQHYLSKYSIEEANRTEIVANERRSDYKDKLINL